MASLVETTAVALRRGNHNANLSFTGVEGEVVVDLGEDSTGTDSNTTLRLHNGSTVGGIPMARADLRNITTESFAKNRETLGDKNLAYADLANFTELSNSEEDNRIKTKIVNTLHDYGLAKENEITELGKNVALKNMSNVNTSSLARGRGDDVLEDGNLAYTSTSNINTRNLASDTFHNDEISGNKPLAYADLENVTTTSLSNKGSSIFAQKDLSNVPETFWENKLIGTGANEYNLETKSNKDTVIPVDGTQIESGHYPTTAATKNYVDNKISEIVIEDIYLHPDLGNATTWDALYSTDESRYRIGNAKDASGNVDNSQYIINGGSDFIADKGYHTNVALLGTTSKLYIITKEVDTDGNIISADLSIDEGITILPTQPVTVYGQDGKTATVTLISTDSGRKTVAEQENKTIYEYSIDTITSTEGGFPEIDTEYLTDIGDIEELLKIKVLAVDSTGAITNIKFDPYIIKDSLSINSVDITSATNTTATISLIYTNTLPGIGGAGLARSDLTNLRGMSDLDSEIEDNAKWRIRHDLPLTINGTSSEQDYFRIVTAGLVQDVLNKILNGDISGTLTSQTTTLTEHSTKVATTSYVWDLILKKMTPNYAGQVINSGATSYTTPSDGWVYTQAFTNNGQTATFSISGKEVWRHYSAGDRSSTDVSVSGLYFVRKGTVCTASYPSNNDNNCIGFYPML